MTGAGLTGRRQTKPARILLVEDEAVNRALLRAILARSKNPAVRSAELVEAESVRAARRALADGSFALVLLDVQLPDGSGLDLARELLEKSLADRPRIVIMSAGVLAAQREAAVAAGSDAFIGKPYQLAEVDELLARFIE
jgi:two-component system, OmpR family, KDP operon response regulator KdpE